MYNDEYQTCYATYVTLCIYYDETLPEKLSEYLELTPTETQVKGEPHRRLRGETTKLNGWFLTTKGIINSKDCRRHLDQLLDTILPAKDKLQTLIAAGAQIDICCYWASVSGQGGPTLSPQQLTKLATLSIELSFDIY